MKPRYLLVFILFVIALNGSAQKKQLVILHTNDTHSCIMPLSVNLSDTLVAGRGGFVRRATMLQEARKRHPDLLLFDSGDFSQGSPYYTLYRGDVEIELMNEMQYTASTVGNHEFDFGMENMAHLFSKARFPILCSNYDFTGTVLEGLVKPYMTFRHNGVKIGVFALDPELDGLVFSKNCQGVKYLDPIRVANDMATMLKKQKKCDVVICISHLGWNLHGIDDTEVIAGSRNIDLVLGGHSHTYFHTLQYVKDLDGREVPVDQNGKHAVYVGKIVLTLDKGK
ncbi:bifunctional metallophosphatase/5'-nucleotidase [Hoylesella marshii]|uniref:Ser/Thr phosphatase family protein n=1 Tax=Hoylesella marshii DSM 16973 = JCM 13450 TaxID=862515 RepID=E0NSC4_9BACT|nr:metallophosphatase [Hoylesella marshii]EFM01980.1 Ser/Thr phosphatase family protein [Hoylesella marshii DSM 16973 = JCM 13450]